MSDTWLRYVPADPHFRPSATAATAAERLLSAFLPDAPSVSSEFHEGVTFFHPGANWSGVHCPSCGADAESWWADAMDAAAESNFKTLTLVAPCCAANVSLNELRYGWPAAFGVYSLEAMNPNSTGLSSGQLAQISAALGSSVREIPVRL